MKRLLIVLFAISIHALANNKIEIRTHDQTNPFDKNSVTIVNENNLSWRNAQWTPVVQVLASDNNTVSNMRDGTGFVVARYQHEDLTKGVFVLTDYHVLPLTPAYSYNSASDMNIKIRFFDQRSRKFSGHEKAAQVVSFSNLSDLVLLKVQLTPDELGKIILPPLVIQNPTAFEENLWSPTSFRIQTAESQTYQIGYTEIMSNVLTSMTTIDGVNSLATGVDEFWHIPLSYAQGMSGGPLIGRNVVSKDSVTRYETINGNRISYNDAIFGALGFIFEPGFGDGYAYPLDNYFIDLINQAISEWKGQSEKRSMGDVPVKINFEGIIYDQDIKQELMFRNPVVTSQVDKKLIAGRIGDALSFTLSGKDVKGNSIALTFDQSLDWETMGAPRSGVVGASGTPGGGSGTPGGANGTPGGGNGTPGADGNPGQNLVAKYMISLTTNWGAQSIYRAPVKALAAPGFSGVQPVKHIKELFDVISKRRNITIYISNPYSNPDDQVEGFYKWRRTPEISHDLDVVYMIKRFTNLPIKNTNVKPVAEGRFVNANEKSLALSGSMTFHIASDLDFGMKFSLIRQPDQSWKPRKIIFLRNNVEVPSKYTSRIRFTSDFPNGRMRITIYDDQKILGSIWP